MDTLILTLLNDSTPIGLTMHWLLQSALVALFFLGLLWSCKNMLASNSKHLLLLCCFFCLAMLPVLSLLNFYITPQDSLGDFVLMEVAVTANAEPLNILYVNSTLSLNGILLACYLAPTSLLVIRLLRSIRALKKATHFALTDAGDELQTSVDKTRTAMGIRRPVCLKYLAGLPSPMSFGLLQPTIVLPTVARSWNQRIVTNVISHELCHIKRNDWISQISCYLVASFFWPNPLVWRALGKVIEESEHSCDSRVLCFGNSSVHYAESLLEVARNASHKPANTTVTQPMLGNSNLNKRIKRILEDNMAARQSGKSFLIVLAILTTSVLAACTETRVLSAESSMRPPPAINRDSRGEILPITAVAPQYPTRAAFGGIEGWALVEFTVLASGEVDSDSVTIVDAEPNEIFNNASLRAARKFTFAPVAGQTAQDIKGVQYLFRFSLGEDDDSTAINRDLQPIAVSPPQFPAAARNANLPRGTVWTVFHVTREGSVRDVEVRYSSDDVFNEAAIAAAQKLQFQPRPDGEVTHGAVRGDTSGLIRAQYLFRFEDGV